MHKQYYLTSLFLLAGLAMVLGQGKLQGKVTDEAGKPLEKAFISTADKRISTLSNELGLFDLTLRPSDSIILISSLGYSSQKTNIKGKASINIRLKADAIAVEEIAVYQTGYQSIPKERATGSFETISGAELQKRTTQNILEKLEGLAPSLQFDSRNKSDLKINIRGINSMTNSMTKILIIVDNFPYEGDLKNINPNEVESVTLLKDAAAASIWGARAGNGVLVINTKKPKAQEQAVKLGFNSSLYVVGKPKLFDLPIISSSEYIDVESFLFNQGHYDAAYTGINWWKTIFSPVVEMLFDHRDKGALSDAELKTKIDAFRGQDYRNDLLKYFLQDQVSQQYSLNASGGNAKNAWAFSLGYDKALGEQIGTKNDRITTSIQNTLHVSKKLRLDLTSRYSRNNSFSDAARISYPYHTGTQNLAAYIPLVGDNGETLIIPKTYNSRYLESLADLPLLDWYYYPLDERGKTTGNVNRNHWANSLSLSYNLIEGMKISATYYNEIQQGDGNIIYSEKSYYARNLINTFSQVNGNSVSYGLPKGAIREDDNSKLQSHKFRGGLNYDKAFADKTHQVSAILGAEISNTRATSNSSGYYGYDPRVLTTHPVDYINYQPTITGGYGIINSFGSFSRTTSRFVSFYGNAAYTFKEKYITSFSARKDATNTFGVKTNDRWNPLWSSGLAWIASKESFLADQVWLSHLKLRATYGHSGNSGGTSSSLPIIIHIDPYINDPAQRPFAGIASLPNPVLKWEDVRMINLGVDFAILNNKISGSFEYFDKKMTDLLDADQIGLTNGMTSITKNVSKMSGHGFDASFSTNLNIGRVRWLSRVFLSHNRSKVKVFKGKVNLASSYVSNTGTLMRPLPDKELYPVFALPFAGLDPENGDPKGYLNGEVSKDYINLQRDSLQNIRYYGSALPPYHGSFSQTFAWRGLELSFMLMFKFGHHFQKETIKYGDLYIGKGHSDYKKRWQFPGDEKYTTIPSQVYPAQPERDNFYAYSEANIADGAVLRLKDARLAYSFAPRIGQKQLAFAIFGSLNNVGILWRANKSGLDPDYQGLPPNRQVNLGFNCSF